MTRLERIELHIGVWVLAAVFLIALGVAFNIGAGLL